MDWRVARHLLTCELHRLQVSRLPKPAEACVDPLDQRRKLTSWNVDLRSVDQDDIADQIDEIEHRLFGHTR